MPDHSSVPLPVLVAGFVAAFVLSLLLVLTKRWHGRFSLDGSEGVQKFHVSPTPRVGGVALYLASLATLIFLEGEARTLMAMILAAGIPAFLAGFIEDITKKVSPRSRLLSTMVSGAIFAIGFGFAFDLADLQWVANIVQVGWPVYLFAIALLVIGMAGVANAVNIIDGFHGLASGSLIIMQLAFAAIALSVGDGALASVAFGLAAVQLGFLAMNFPLGKIFLGDAGAYFAGFALAAVAVMVTTRNEAVSPFVALLVIFYPVYETLFSIRRKRRREGHSPSQPDGVHLHMLVNRSLARPLSDWTRLQSHRNALTGLLMWPFSMVCALMAIAASGSGRAAIVGCVVFAMLYGRIYLMVSLQRTPLLNKAERALKRRAGEEGAA